MRNISEEWENVIRRVRSKPMFFHNGRPSSALFKDSNGVSVNKDICIEKNVCVIADPLEENVYHALLQRSENEVELTAGQAKALARNAIVIKDYQYK